MQIITRYLLHARQHIGGTKDRDINMADTEQRQKESTTHSPSKNENWGRQRLGIKTKVI